MQGEATYLDITPQAGQAFFSAPPPGELVMLNLLRFRAVADYSATPALAPATPISGEDAYRRYIAHTAPLLERSGGQVMFLGRAHVQLIGPPGEYWDAAMLVRQRDARTFLAFASDPESQAGIGHRTAALADSRLLPLTQDF
ncbi:DUF1330 domain-containing protein [Pseudoxanthomonas sp.]|uniref:DUF1330 domain-containing protein n=1 Tax=Pseudoxanthomonas sp. TaxID=1871049 RepID=UPI002606DB97|nr:DUF1330 domain-containing protein [Pseudoxanthomonas sp.]WDS37941.1 MAG: DUF1330 domain-containing protein [Pseudoxanthomonas sp.]